MRVFKALAWLRWRLLANSIRTTESRDLLEHLSRVTALIAPGLLMASSLSSVVLAIGCGGMAGWLLVTERFQSGWVLAAIRVGLLLATVFVALFPLFAGMRGGTARFARLLLLPIPQRTLHLVEVTTSLIDPWVIFVAPGLVAVAGGMMTAAIARPDGWTRYSLAEGIVALAGAIGMALVLASLSACVTFLVNWIVRDRRRSERFVVGLIIGLSVVSILPAIVSSRMGAIASTNALPAWTAALPSELYAESLKPGLPAWPLIALFAEGVILYGLSFVVHRHLLVSTEGGRLRRQRAAVASAAAVRVPGLWPGTSAVAVAQARTALRSVRGRLVVLLPGPLAGMVAVLTRSMSESAGWAVSAAPPGHLLFAGGILLGLYAAQPLTMNQFGSDRAGLTLQFLAPIRDVDLIRGKAVGCGVIVGGGALVTLMCTLLSAPRGSPLLWSAALLGGMATYLVLSPAAALFSVLLPVSADLSKTGTGGNPHTLSVFAGIVLVAVTALPAAIALLVLSPHAALTAMALWLATALITAYFLLGWVARLLRARRENLALIAQGR